MHQHSSSISRVSHNENTRYKLTEHNYSIFMQIKRVRLAFTNFCISDCSHCKRRCDNNYPNSVLPIEGNLSTFMFIYYNMKTHPSTRNRISIHVAINFVRKTFYE